MPDATSYILYDVSDGIATLTFNRPARKNALTVAMYVDALARLHEAEADKDVRVIVITAVGDAFTSGNDLNDFLDTPPDGPDSPVMKLLMALLDAEKPLIVGVNGTAIGVGVTMLPLCDLVYAATETRFQMPFVNLGVTPEGASSMLLPLMMGHQKASELLLLGEWFTTPVALSVGLVNAVYPRDSLQEAVRERALLLASRPSESVRLSKQLMREPVREKIRETLLREGVMFVERIKSPAAIEALTAFFEKRKPDFRQFGE